MAPVITVGVISRLMTVGNQSTASSYIMSIEFTNPSETSGYTKCHKVLMVHCAPPKGIRIIMGWIRLFHWHSMVFVQHAEILPRHITYISHLNRWLNPAGTLQSMPKISIKRDCCFFGTTINFDTAQPTIPFIERHQSATLFKILNAEFSLTLFSHSLFRTYIGYGLTFICHSLCFLGPENLHRPHHHYLRNFLVLSNNFPILPCPH